MDNNSTGSFSNDMRAWTGVIAELVYLIRATSLTTAVTAFSVSESFGVERQIPRRNHEHQDTDIDLYFGIFAA